MKQTIRASALYFALLLAAALPFGAMSNAAMAAGQASADAQPGAANMPQTVDAFRQQGYAVRSISPIFGQLFMFSFPQGFQTVFENTRGDHYIREAVLAGENENKWTQMVTVTGIRDLSANPNVTPKIFAQGMAGGFKRACPASFSAVSVMDGDISGHDAFAAVVSCGTSPASNGTTSEAALILVIKGDHDYYTLQWAERGTPSATPVAIDGKKWSDKFARLAPVKLCPIVPGEAAPYASCAGSK